MKSYHEWANKYSLKWQRVMLVVSYKAFKSNRRNKNFCLCVVQNLSDYGCILVGFFLFYLFIL